MVDIAPIKGLIELEDHYTSELGLAQAALSNFTKTNQESLKAVAASAGLVGAAIIAIGTATVELGKHGADVNDVDETLQHFAGSAKEANEIVRQLQEGTKGTVDKFALAGDAARLLSANVKLTAQDFGTLGQAAFVLQNRGLGDTKEQLDLVSDALITGRTRTLAMKLGVVDAGDAQAEYAEKLGITKEQLSDTGKAEANRLAVMRLLSAAVKDAGNQERDFGEEFEAAGAHIQDFIDDVASAIAQSTVFKAGLETVGNELSDAFGQDHTEAVNAVVHAIEQGAIKVVDFAQVTISAAKVMDGAWNAIKALVLGVEGIIVAAVDGVVEGLTAVAQAEAKLHLVDASVAEGLVDTRTQLRAMTASLNDQATEAAKGVFGQTEFSKSLDTVSGRLQTVRDAMVKASQVAQEHKKSTDEVSDSTSKLKDAQDQLSASMIDRAKVEEELEKIEQKSLQETQQVWNDYFALRAQHGTSALEAQKAAIQAWFDDEVSKLDASDRNWQEHYDALDALAKEKLEDIKVDWQTLRDKSIDALQDQLEVAENTYEQMELHAEHFTREALEEQRQKVEQARDAARGMGQDFVAAHQAAAKAADEQTTELEKLEKAAREAAEASAAIKGSFDVTRANIEQTAQGFGIQPDVAIAWAKLGYSFEQILQFAKKFGYPPPGFPEGPGPRIPGFAEGGTVMVGENGPEVVRLPLGSTVYPHGMGAPNGRTGDTTLVFNVNGTAEEAWRKIKKIAVQDLQLGQQFSRPV